MIDEVPGVESEERERHNFQRGEARRQAHVERSLAREVPVVAGADDPAREIQDGVQVDQARGGPGADEPHLVEHHGHQHRREEFEESLHPEMDDPEAPVVDDGEVGVGAVEKGGQVEDRDGHGRIQEERGQFALVRALDGGPERPEHQKQPEHEASCQQELPEAPEVQVLGALVPEPEPELAQLVVDAQALAGQAADNDHHQRRQEVRTRRISGVLGSAPPTHGARNRPPPTQAVAIQKIASWRCQVRARL